MLRLSLPIIVLISSVGLAQDIPQDRCVRTSDNHTEDIQKLFPFNHARKIMIVSFKTSAEKIVYGIPTLNGQVNLSSLYELKKLNKKSKAELLDLLININYDPAAGDTVKTGDPFHPISIEREVTVNMCYTPRHAILFENDDGRIYSYVEISFECLRYKTEPDDLNVGDFCSEKFQMLRDFFRRKGVFYGN